MLYKTILKVGLCLLLLPIASYSAAEPITSKEAGEVTEAETGKVSGAKTTEASGIETAQTESKEVINDASKVLISLGDKKLTMQQVKWMQPDADNQTIARLANWWLENELLYAEAQKRGITEEPKAKFLAELRRKSMFSQELMSRVRDTVKVTDQKVLDYYEKNKDTDPMLKQPGYLSFSHIRTKTLEQGQAILERIKAGEDINELAKKLSIYGDAREGGVAKRYTYSMVKSRFATKFFEALVAAKKGELIGPIKVNENAYEVARQEDKIEPEILPFEKVKNRIMSKLQRLEKGNAFTELLNSLKEQAADKIVRSSLITEAEKPAGSK